MTSQMICRSVLKDIIKDYIDAVDYNEIDYITDLIVNEIEVSIYDLIRWHIERILHDKSYNKK